MALPVTTGDLSRSFRYQLPGLPAWMPRVVFGAQDLSGNSFFKAKFVVPSQALDP